MESQASPTPKSNETVRPVHRAGSVAVAQPAKSATQLATFEAAMRLFHSRRFREAREGFVKAMEGTERDIAQRSGLHIRMCDRRLQEEAVALDSAEDHYNYAVALINTRSLPAAQEHLRKALELAPNSDHVHYALALASALSGDQQSAYRHLERAIELDPRNRVSARQDADFAPYAHQPPLDALLYPEKRNW